ncbi:hypothetical protein [Natronorubrum tibetense]|uniref:Uncharacterized protein n=1 Tax=Natronorubrum tibetense GA33 TaxID=1114856 RepID=L9VJK4_9EURY|nr:hypothetical protein [Natronorubrum tibetense]ELY37251.1 hypothetical protein C496_20480 [Natronorubrum tibetense GA33]
MTLPQVTVRLPRRLGHRARAWPAYLLAVCFPGTGHLYNGQWKRGCSWAALCGLALVFLSPGTLLVAGTLTEPIVVTALRLEAISFADVAFPLTIIALSTIDLYARTAIDAGAVYSNSR